VLALWQNAMPYCPCRALPSRRLRGLRCPARPYTGSAAPGAWLGSSKRQLRRRPCSLRLAPGRRRPKDSGW